MSLLLNVPHYDEILLKNPNKQLINETIAYYQTASELLKYKKYNTN